AAGALPQQQSDPEHAEREQGHRAGGGRQERIESGPHGGVRSVGILLWSEQPEGADRCRSDGHGAGDEPRPGRQGDHRGPPVRSMVWFFLPRTCCRTGSPVWASKRMRAPQKRRHWGMTSSASTVRPPAPVVVAFLVSSKSVSWSAPRPLAPIATTVSRVWSEVMKVAG